MFARLIEEVRGGGSLDNGQKMGGGFKLVLSAEMWIGVDAKTWTYMQCCQVVKHRVANISQGFCNIWF